MLYFSLFKCKDFDWSRPLKQFGNLLVSARIHVAIHNAEEQPRNLGWFGTLPFAHLSRCITQSGCCETAHRSKFDFSEFHDSLLCCAQITAVGDISYCGSLLTLQLQSNLICTVDSLSRSRASAWRAQPCHSKAPCRNVPDADPMQIKYSHLLV